MVSSRVLTLILLLLLLARTGAASPKGAVFLEMHERSAMVGTDAAGIIVGARAPYLYILTVRHAWGEVESDCLNLAVGVQGAGADPLTVAACKRLAELDAALLWVKAPTRIVEKYEGKFLRIRTDLVSYWPAAPAQSIYTDELIDERVRVVGSPNFHPWTVSSEVAIKRSDRTYFELDRGDLTPGYSGGPVFTKEGYVVGMFYGYDNQGYAYRIDALLSILRRMENLELPVSPNGRVPHRIVPMSRIFLANHSRRFYSPTTEGFGLGAGLGVQLWSFSLREAVEVSIPLMLEVEFGSLRPTPDAERSLLFETRLAVGARYALLGFMMGASYSPGYVALKDASGFRARALRVEVGYQSPQSSHGAAVGAVTTRWHDDSQDFTFLLGYELAYESALGI
jgi:hypothetical protein